MVKKIIESFKGELDEFEKKKFEERKDLDNAMFLLEERAYTLKIRKLISIELFEEYYYRIRKRYCEERVRFQEKENGESARDCLLTDRDKRQFSCLNEVENGTNSMSSWRLTVAGNEADKQVKERIKAEMESQ